MIRTLRLTVWAFSISFLGSLPLGTLNVSVSELVVTHRNAAAVEFGAGAIAVELLLVRVALVAIDQLARLRRLFRLFQGLTVMILLTLAASSLKAAWQHQPLQASASALAYLHPLVAGLLLSLLNPLHLPFWMGWTAALRSKGILDPTGRAYNMYLIGIGLGTSLAFVCYGVVGDYLQTHIERQQPLINAAVGLALLGTAILQGCKLFPSAKMYRPY